MAITSWMVWSLISFFPMILLSVCLLYGIEYSVMLYIPMSLFVWWQNRASWQWLLMVIGLPALFFLNKFNILSLQMSISIGCGFVGMCFSVLIDTLLTNKKLK
ncbi:hypothetical protein HB435_002601 [Salmonella enterica subsp. enterica serovar Stanley]|nr:hypothetical protein [Salmonella enterica subsp. enterica serovar Stanley]